MRTYTTREAAALLGHQGANGRRIVLALAKRRGIKGTPASDAYGATLLWTPAQVAAMRIPLRRGRPAVGPEGRPEGP